MATLGVSKVVASGHPDFKTGDHVWGMMGCEEYTLVSHPESLFKINHPEFPLSYYIGVLGESNFICHKRGVPVNKTVFHMFVSLLTITF